MAMLERKPRSNREGIHSGSSNYTALISSLMKDKHLNQTQQRGQGNQNYNNKEMAETSSDELPQQGYENMNRVPHLFYRQLTYNEQPKVYIFTDTNVQNPSRD